MTSKRTSGKARPASRKGGGRRTGSSRKRRRARPGTVRRRLWIATGVLAVAGSLLVSVNRTSAGRMLAESLSDYRTEEQLLVTRLADELVRVDSLSSRERILAVGSRQGLRPARDDEVLHLPDVRP